MASKQLLQRQRKHQQQQQQQQQRDRRLLKEIHPSLQCLLCYGYLIDAATITECLHSFCKSCILVYLRKKSRSCPVCGFCLSVTNPQIRLDKILQDIVYKVVPNLYRNEMTKRTKFYNDSDSESNVSSQWSDGSETSDSDLSDPNDDKDDGISSLSSSSSSSSSSLSSPARSFFYRKPKQVPMKKIVRDRKSHEKKRVLSEIPERIVFDASDSISVELIARSGQVQFAPTANIYLCCPALFRIELMKKFCYSKFNLPADVFEIEIFYEGLPLLDTFTLMDIAYISNWKQTAPLRLYFTLYPLESAETKPKVQTEEPRIRTRTASRTKLTGNSQRHSSETHPKKLKKTKVTPQTDVPTRGTIAIKSPPSAAANRTTETKVTAAATAREPAKQTRDALQNKDDEMKKLFFKAINLISRV